MFNANLDASPSERKTLQQLRKELKKWEEGSSTEKTRKTKPNNLDLNTYAVRYIAFFPACMQPRGFSIDGHRCSLGAA